MQLIDLLNQLDRAGTLGQLYQAGIVNLTAYSRREVYGTYRALLATPNYAEQAARAVQATADQCGVARSTVYAAIREMERVV
jgi:hypothetical protein